MKVSGTATEGGALAVSASSSKDGSRDGSEGGAKGLANTGVLAADIGGRSWPVIATWSASLSWKAMSLAREASSSGSRAWQPAKGYPPSGSPAGDASSSGTKSNNMSEREEAAEEATEGAWDKIPSLRGGRLAKGSTLPALLEADSP